MVLDRVKLMLIRVFFFPLVFVLWYLNKLMVDAVKADRLKRNQKGRKA